MQKLIFVATLLLIIQVTSCIKDDVIDYDVLIEVKFFKDNQNITDKYKIDSIKVHTSCLAPTEAQPIKHADSTLIYGLRFCCRNTEFATVRISKGNYLSVNDIDRFKIQMEYLDTTTYSSCEIIGATSIPNYSEISYANKKITVSITE